MPGMCSVPGCKGYKKARSRGVVFHSLPTRDPGRCRLWLKAVQNPKFDQNTPVSKYGNIRVCSQHFTAEDYEPDIQAELMKTTPRKILKSFAIPSVFTGRQQEELSTSVPAQDCSQAEAKAPSTGAQASLVSGSSVDSVLQRASALTSGLTSSPTSSQASSVTVHITDVDTATLSFSLPTPVDSGARSTSSKSHPPAEVSESFSSVSSEDRLSDSFHQETELNSTATSKPDKNTEEDLSQSKTIVNDSCLMELFKKCQTCGQPITKKKVSHCGAQKKVRWSCLGGHRGLWMSSPHLWEAFPEIHLLTALSVLFSGGAFTHFKKWAKHLQLNFMGQKTFFEIQKAYLNPEMKQMNRTEQEKIFEKGVCQVPEGTLLHISDPLKKIKSKSKRRDKGVVSSQSSYEQRSSISLISTAACMQQPTALSSLGHVSASESFEEMEVTIDDDDEDKTVKNRVCDLDSDMENVVETTEQSAPGADDCSDDEIYVPIIPQRSTASEFFLECEEEELEPWQKQISHVRVKMENDDGEFSNDQIDCKPKLSLLQRNALRSNTEFIGSLGVQCHAGNSITIVPVTQQQLFQKMVTPKVKEEPYDPISNPVSLSSVQSPVVYAPSSTQLQSDQSNSQTLPVPFSCFTVLKSTGTSKKQ